MSILSERLRKILNTQRVPAYRFCEDHDIDYYAFMHVFNQHTIYLETLFIFADKLQKVPVVFQKDGVLYGNVTHPLATSKSSCKALAPFLQYFKREGKLTLRAIQYETSLSQNSVQKMLRGQQNYKIKTLERFCNMCDVQVSYLENIDTIKPYFDIATCRMRCFDEKALRS